nr:abortive infection family protein [uncultured Rhizobium sp.]
MVDEEELPSSLLERALMMEQLLTASATGSAADTSIYEYLRQEFVQSDELKNLLPSFVRTSRTLDTFWPFIKRTAASYAERREFISQQFMPLIEHLEGRNRHPGDNVTSDALVSFDADGVHAVWNKALARRQSDPEGAITIARTLLETVCKRVLDELEVTYTDKEDLPLLYRMAAKELNLAPDQHTEEPIKQILGSAMTLVNGIGTLRNRLSDAHGRGGALPVRPSPRHASLAVNTAGAVATFLVETLATKKG